VIVDVVRGALIVDVVRGALTALVLVAAIIGFLFITRGTAVRHVRGVGGDAEPVSPSEPEFSATVMMLTSASLLPGNRVELALDGDGMFERLWADLQSAQRAITIQMYYMLPGKVADRLRDILRERAKAGVRVFFLYDAFGAAGMPRAYWAALRDAGVRVVSFRPLRFRNLWVVQNRSHVRGIVIDGRIGWTGGFGIDDKWLGDGHTNLAWRETNVRFEGPAVAQLQAAFAAAWAESTGVLVSGRINMSRCEGGVHAAGLLFTAPTLGSTSAERFLALSIAGARRSLYVTNAYFAPDRGFTQLLADVARRGVDVRVLVGGAPNRRSGGPPRGACALRPAAVGRCADLRIPAVDAAREGVRRRRLLGHGRHDELRQSFARAQRRVHAHGARRHGRRADGADLP
jgi:cardiolipin synthase